MCSQYYQQNNKLSKQLQRNSIVVASLGVGQVHNYKKGTCCVTKTVLRDEQEAKRTSYFVNTKLKNKVQSI